MPAKRRLARSRRLILFHVRQQRRAVGRRAREPSPHVGAVNNGYGNAPIALPRNQPVAQAVVDNALADIVLFQPANNCADGFLVVGQAGKRELGSGPGVGQRA